MRILCDDGDKEIVYFFTWCTQPNMFLVNDITFEWLKIQKDDFFYQPSVLLVPGAIKTLFERKMFVKVFERFVSFGKMFLWGIRCFIKIDSFWNPLQFYIDGCFLIFLFLYNMCLLFTWWFLLIECGKRWSF